MDVDFRLYLITDRTVAKMPLPEAVQLALQGGVRAIQLREKGLPVRELLSLAQEVRSTSKEFGAKLFINDRVDIAVAVEADGVHLGRQSMPASAVRKIVGPDMLIGVSTHNVREAEEAEKEGADFITYGPVFETPSKTRYGPPVGIYSLKMAKKNVHIPVFALGGVKSGIINEIFNAGADGVAVISAIFGADNIKNAAELLNREIAEAVNASRRSL